MARTLEPGSRQVEIGTRRRGRPCRLSSVTQIRRASRQRQRGGERHLRSSSPVPRNVPAATRSPSSPVSHSQYQSPSSSPSTSSVDLGAGGRARAAARPPPRRFRSGRERDTSSPAARRRAARRPTDAADHRRATTTTAAAASATQPPGARRARHARSLATRRVDDLRRELGRRRLCGARATTATGSASGSARADCGELAQLGCGTPRSRRGARAARSLRRVRSARGRRRRGRRVARGTRQASSVQPSSSSARRIAFSV